MANNKFNKFNVGDGVHWGFNGDSDPGTVQKVSPSGKTVWVSQDDYRVIDDRKGFFEGPIKCMFETIAGEPIVFKQKKDGSFRRQGNKYCFLGQTRIYARNPCI